MIITREHRSKPYPLGVRVVGDALEVAVYSESADAVDLCVFDDAGRETAHRLPERSGHVFHGRVEGYGVGTRTGGACSVPAASRTDALMPLPPQSTARV